MAIVNVGYSGGQTNEDTLMVGGYTRINYAYGPANTTSDPATITNVYIEAADAITGVIVGIYAHESGIAFTCKDTETIGSVSSGTQTFTGLDLTCNNGEFIGIYATGYGYIKVSHDSNDIGVWSYVQHSQCTTVDTEYNFFSNTPDAMCLWGRSAGKPTVTTQAASSVTVNSATGNGNITALGGQVPSYRGFEWDVHTHSGGAYANKLQDNGTYSSTGAFTKELSSLPAGTTIYARAFAGNVDGTAYGDEVTFLTKPAAPTGVGATDGTYTDKVVVTWTKSTGASGYRVYRDGSDISGLLGDVATYDDTGASAPSITAGTAAASDGTSTAHVALSLSGQAANNGSSHTYKVVAVNATGNSADSSTDTGYRGVGTLTYQWQRSAADSDATYSDISGATTASYNDTGAPADGSGRYYKCVINATGASAATSTANRGYRLSIKIPQFMNHFRKLRG